MRSFIIIAFLAACLNARAAFAQDQPIQEVVARVIAAAGGPDKQLKLFRMVEQLNVSSDPEKKGNERISVLEPPAHWWLGKKDRVKEEKEPATYLVWAWTLGALTDQASKVELIEGVLENEAKTLGLRISGSIMPPLDMHFSEKDHRLVRIDWRNDIHRFSDWQDYDGTRYPAKCIGYKKASGKPWYFSEIKKLERLTELPAGLTR